MESNLIKHFLVKADVEKYFLFEEYKSGFRKQLFHKLSKQNCDEIFGVVDVDKLAEEECLDEIYWVKRFYKKGFNKAMELNKDKVFTKFDIISAFEYGWNQRHFDKTDEDELREIQKRLIQSLQQPTEIEVEIVTWFYGTRHKKGEWIPKIDAEGCTLLKKK